MDMGIGPELARSVLRSTLMGPSTLENAYDVLCTMVEIFGRDRIDNAMATIPQHPHPGLQVTFLCECEDHLWDCSTIAIPSIIVRNLDEFYTAGWSFTYVITPEGRWYSSPRCPECARRYAENEKA